MPDTKISGLTPGGPAQRTDLMATARGSSSPSLSVGDVLAAVGTNMVTVDPVGNGGDFTSIDAAITFVSAQTPTATSTWCIMVEPGVYDIAAGLTLPDYTTLFGRAGARHTILRATAGTLSLLTLSTDSQVTGLSLDSNGQTDVTGITFGSGPFAGEAKSCIAISCAVGYNHTGTGSAIPTDCLALQQTDVLNTNIGFHCSNGRMETYVSRAATRQGIAAANKMAVGWDADNGEIVCRAGTATRCISGIRIRNGGTFNASSVTADANDIAVDIPAVGSNSSIIASGFTITASVQWDLLAASPTASIIGTGTGNRSKFFAHPDAFVEITFLNLDVGDEGLVVAGELQVGSPERPKESVLGEGDSFTQGMLVYTVDDVNSPTSVVDVATEAGSGDSSTFAQLGAVDSAIYLSSSIRVNGAEPTAVYHRFMGIKALLTVAAAGGDMVMEYWNNSAWVPFNTMSTAGGRPYSGEADALLRTSGSHQIRFDHRIKALWARYTPPELGALPELTDDFYWIRIRVTSALTTPATFEQIKLHTNRFEINGDGFTEFFGSARPIIALPIDAGSAQAGNASPANQDIGLSDELVVGRIENEFQDNTTDRQAFLMPLPPNLDTSTPVQFRFSYYLDVAANPAETVQWEIHWARSQDGDAVFDGAGGPATAPGEQSVIIDEDVSSEPNDIQRTVIVDLDVSAFEPPDGNTAYLWVSLARNGSVDSYGSNCIVMQYTPLGLAWAAGNYADNIFG